MTGVVGPFIDVNDDVFTFSRKRIRIALINFPSRYVVSLLYSLPLENEKGFIINGVLIGIPINIVIDIIIDIIIDILVDIQLVSNKVKFWSSNDETNVNLSIF